ncbi:Olfactory Receptor 2F2 [Manis pentadactyla]|nr:Olfactory Receptor 2F2 [Manis pentadactyla]
MEIFDGEQAEEGEMDTKRGTGTLRRQEGQCWRAGIVHASGTLFLVFFSYARIVTTILGIGSTTGRSKAFSTCSSPPTAVSCCCCCGPTFLYHLMSTSGPQRKSAFSVQYSVVSPLVNPLVYSLKNKEVKAALKRMLQKGPQHRREQAEGDWEARQNCIKIVN